MHLMLFRDARGTHEQPEPCWSPCPAARYGGLIPSSLAGWLSDPRSIPVNDFPAALAAVNHVEPVPRRIRAVLGGQAVLDTVRALYVWERPFYPQYYVPLADVRRDLLIPEERPHQPTRAPPPLPPPPA